MIAALDGVRAIAVLMVLLCHLPANLFSGGFAGVDVFFVLSGFLITTTLMRGFQARGRSEFGHFYFRRALRLWLPLALCLVLAAGLWNVMRGAQPDFQTAALAAALNFANWQSLRVPDSLGLLSHTWSLSIEEQFYLVWPLGLWLWVSRSRDPLPTLLTVIGTVWLVRALLALSGSEVNLEYNSLTRMDAILCGCVLSLSQHRPWFQGPRLRWLHHPVTGALALVILVASLFGPPLGRMYLALGIPLITLATAALITQGLSRRPSSVLRLLEWAPMGFIGRRSYGLYLYHFPIFYTVNSFRTAPTRSNFITFSFVAFSAALIVACLSFWLEEPLMRWGRAWLDGRLRPQRGTTENPVHFWTG